METQNNYNVDKLEFRQIVLGHIKRILEIGSHELRDTTRQIDTANHTQIIEQEDTRYSYIQAIENLAYVLIPYFDDEILQVYERCERIINGFGYEVRNILNKTFERIKKETGKENLENVLPQTIKLLVRSGRLAVISYHSLEDKIVKDFFREERRKGILEVLTKKPIVATRAESMKNPRSRSAKLRIAKLIA